MGIKKGDTQIAQEKEGVGGLVSPGWMLLPLSVLTADGDVTYLSEREQVCLCPQL